MNRTWIWITWKIILFKNCKINWMSWILCYNYEFWLVYIKIFVTNSKFDIHSQTEDKNKIFTLINQKSATISIIIPMKIRKTHIFLHTIILIPQLNYPNNNIAYPNRKYSGHHNYHVKLQLNLHNYFVGRPKDRHIQY